MHFNIKKTYCIKHFNLLGFKEKWNQNSEYTCRRLISVLIGHTFTPYAPCLSECQWYHTNMFCLESFIWSPIIIKNAISIFNAPTISGEYRLFATRWRWFTAEQSTWLSLWRYVVADDRPSGQNGMYYTLW